MAADDDRRNKQKCFKHVEFEADIDAGFRHQQRTDRVADGAQQAHHAQQLQDRHNTDPFFTEHQRHHIAGDHHQPQQRREVNDPHHRQQLVEVDPQLVGIVLNFGERREQYAGDDRVKLHRRHHRHVVGQVITRAVNLTAKVAEQQRAHGRVHQIAKDGRHRQRPEVGADHGKGKPGQHRAGFNHADFAELQLLLHQGAELLPMGDDHKSKRQGAH